MIEQNFNSKIELLKSFLQENDLRGDLNKELFFTFENKEEIIPGIIYLENKSEINDNHCLECQEEFLAFKAPGPNQNLPFYLAISVGPTKFEKIKLGILKDPLMKQIKLEVM